MRKISPSSSTVSSLILMTPLQWQWNKQKLNSILGTVFLFYNYLKWKKKKHKTKPPKQTNKQKSENPSLSDVSSKTLCSNRYSITALLLLEEPIPHPDVAMCNEHIQQNHPILLPRDKMLRITGFPELPEIQFPERNWTTKCGLRFQTMVTIHSSLQELS